MPGSDFTWCNKGRRSRERPLKGGIEDDGRFCEEAAATAIILDATLVGADVASV